MTWNIFVTKFAYTEQNPTLLFAVGVHIALKREAFFPTKTKIQEL